MKSKKFKVLFVFLVAVCCFLFGFGVVNIRADSQVIFIGTVSYSSHENTWNMIAQYDNEKGYFVFFDDYLMIVDYFEEQYPSYYYNGTFIVNATVVGSNANYINVNSISSDFSSVNKQLSQLFIDGYNVGVSESNQNIYDAGYNKAKSDFQSLIDDAYKTGVDVGIVQGRDDGYQEGYDDGYDYAYDIYGSSTIPSMISTIMSEPLKMIKDIFTFSILGIPVYGVLCGITSCLIVFWVVKKVKGL